MSTVFRVTPWNHYKPANQEREPDVPNDNNVSDDMDEDVDMEAPQISILLDDKTPPPAQPKFRVKLLVNDKRRDSSQASREEEPEDADEEEEEEDELIDDDDEDAASAQAGRGGVAPKRSGRNKGRTSGAGSAISRRKSTNSVLPEPAPAVAWFEASGPDADAGKPGESVDVSESASVASATNTPSASTKKRPAAKGGARVRKPPVK